MKCAVEMGLGAVIYTLSFIMTGSDIPKSLEGIHMQSHRQQDDPIRLLSFFQNKESRL
jgi:hypothetical protein